VPGLRELRNYKRAWLPNDLVAGVVLCALLVPQGMAYAELAGLAITIFIGQLPDLLGFSIEGGNVIQDTLGFLSNLDQTNIYTLGVGLLCLVIILGLKRWGPRAPGILIAVVAAIPVTILIDLAAKGVDVVGVLPQGFPRSSFPAVDLSDLAPLAGAAFGITLVALGDTISTSFGFAAKRGFDGDSDQETVGIGAANFLTGLFHGFPISSSSSRTAVAEQSGAKTQLTGVVAAALVLVMLLFAPGLVRNLPQSALAAIIIVASISLFDTLALRHLWVVQKSEFAIAIACILGVTLVGVLDGIVIAVIFSILQFSKGHGSPTPQCWENLKVCQDVMI